MKKENNNKQKSSLSSPINLNQDINLTKNNETTILNNISSSSSSNDFYLSKDNLFNSLVVSSIPSTSNSSLFSLGINCSNNNNSFNNYNVGNSSTGNILARNSTKTLKCPKCNWHYKYQETLEIHMKEKHSDQDVLCIFCLENQTHPKLARGETYSCGYKPYKCELCKYSTTTKGNLSIHMQSDKHLHALQEIPQSLAAAVVAASNSSQLIINGNNNLNNSNQELDISTTFSNNNNCNNKIIGGSLQCLICFNFYTDITEEMVEHFEKDRSQTQECDIATINGFFQCMICPYSTNLKANFQLHTRTDKHLQRVQMINHLREGISGLFGQSEQFARLGTLKSAVQVRCQECEEIIFCIPTLREHCLSQSHQLRMLSCGINNNNDDIYLSQLSSPSEKEENILEIFLNDLIIFCGLCNWNENGSVEIINLAFEHANTHSEQLNDLININDNQFNDNKEEKEINSDNKNKKINKKEDEEELFFCWKNFDKYLINAGLAIINKEEEENKNKNNIEDIINNNSNNNNLISSSSSSSPLSLVKCSFCSAEFDLIKLPKHISEDHKLPLNISKGLVQQIIKNNNNNQQITEESINYSSSISSMDQSEKINKEGEEEKEELNNNIPSTSSIINDNNSLLISSNKKQKLDENIFLYKCKKCLNIAFRSEEQLLAHSLCHSSARFRLKRKNCGNNLKQKISENICQENYDTNSSLVEHFNSEKHLQKAVEQIMEIEEENRSRLNSFSQFSSSSITSTKPSSSKQFLNSRRNSNSSNKYLPYICNICSLSFGQPGTLDTHLRSTAHAQRIVKLNELIKSGELNPQMPVFEQPEPHPPQKSIGELLREKKMQQKMGKLTAIQTAQQPSIPSTSTTTNSSEQQNILEWWKTSSSEQSNNNLMINFMTQLFNNNNNNNEDIVIDNYCTSQMTQIAQMMLNAQMTAAASTQINSSLNSENGKIGLLDLFGIKNEEEINNNNNELLNINSPSYDEPKAKKPKIEKKISEKSGSNEIKKISQNNQINENFDQNKCFGGQNNNSTSAFGDLNFASVLRALTSSSGGFVGDQSTDSSNDLISSQFSSNQLTMTDDPTAFLMATMAAAVAQNNNNNGENTQINQQQTTENSGNQSPSSTQQKRARTRIGDDHVKILRQYFDINNSPSEEQIKEMAKRTNLAEKVIKHWFRNTLFKERQRDKDSPYNFNIPPQMSIDLATYHKTGEAKIVPLIKQEKEENEILDEDDGLIDEDLLKNNNEENSKIIENYQNEIIKDYSEDEQENNIEEEENKFKNKKSLFLAQSMANLENEIINKTTTNQLKSIETVAADLLANIGKQNNTTSSINDDYGQINNSNNIEFGQENQQIISPLLEGKSSFNCFDTAGQFAQIMFSSAVASAGIPSLPFSSFSGLFNPFISTNTATTTSSSTPSINESTNIITSNIQQIDNIINNNPFISSSSTQQITTSSIPSCSSSTSINSINQRIQTNNNNIMTNNNNYTNNGSSSGRRANRTRFTDFQLKTMQEFFDKQAYPKDDDLEMLSKKLGLSPRVIVVWFQNARQKARKVFEQQPHLLSHHSSIIEQVTEGRFSRTPSTNFQCKICGQVFQRYLELIQHQQKICCLSSSSSIKIEEQQNNENNNIGDFNISDFLNGKLTKINEEENNDYEVEEEGKLLLQSSSSENNLNEINLFQQLLAGCSQLQNQIKVETSNDDITTTTSTGQQCPFCILQFNCNEKLIKHISENHLTIPSFNNSTLNEENNKSSIPLDLSVNNNKLEENNNIVEDDEEREENNYSRGEEFFFSNDPSLSPTSCFNNNNNENESSSTSLAILLPSLFGGQKTIIDGNQRQLNNYGGGNNSKRFRTHLTPMQVFVMKSLFHDYKTPSMQECDSLGKKIGLTKRVIQVWFQNTRAKERKTGSSEPEELIPFCGSSVHCQLCDLPIGNNNQLIQEHIFTEKHIEKIKERCSQLKTTIKEEKREEGDNYEGEEEEEKINESEWNNNELILEEENNKNNNQSTSLSPQIGQSLAAQLPYYALAAAAAAGGIGSIPMNGLPLLYDPLLFGTPVSALKVPESVSQQIINDMASGKRESYFTQDGLEINELENKLTENFKIFSCVDLEVGWGCSNCNNVFQQFELLQNHWKLICPTGEDIGAFRLIQSHYQCNPCQKKFGTQDDFCSHCLSVEHKMQCEES